MSPFGQNQLVVNEIPEKQWQRIYMFGGITALVVLIGNLLDVIISIILGGEYSTLPPTAADRFAQFNANWLLGLYNLDLLNVCISIIMIPTFLALCAVHRRVNPAYSTLALLVFSIATAIFITNNTALPMLALSSKYSAATTEVQKTILRQPARLCSREAPMAVRGFFGICVITDCQHDLVLCNAKGRNIWQDNRVYGDSGLNITSCLYDFCYLCPGSEKFGYDLHAWRAFGHDMGDLLYY